ncbi:hypothetical protein [Trinickia acidisoli]|uniref:hypothetical protein n=1 Tax=Trinickia acidisoli TaxID=2767482 RepID=UPI001A8C03CB|nr:hypothetical protein [Trinickia acidisoli]
MAQEDSGLAIRLYSGSVQAVNSFKKMCDEYDGSYDRLRVAASALFALFAHFALSANFGCLATGFCGGVRLRGEPGLKGLILRIGRWR